ncbi:MAG: DUF4003 family protein [Eubacterium sp.]|nr:DUF4003 family protein [Eubacterium sp.]
MEAVITNSLMDANAAATAKLFSMDDHNTRALAAFIYTAQGVGVNEGKIDECKQIIKSEFGTFSEFRNHLQTPLIVKMSMESDPKAYLKGVSDTYERLNRDFKSGDEMRLLGAMILYDNTTEENREQAIDRTLEIYSKMKSEHPILTSRNDIPIAAIMAMQERDIDVMLKDAETCYENLKSRKKISKSDIITVSYILSMTDVPSEKKCDNLHELYTAFKDNKLTLNHTYMTILAILTNCGISTTEAVEQTAAFDEELKKVKLFHGVVSVDSMTRRMFSAAAVALNNADNGAMTESALSSTVISLVISMEILIMIMIINSSMTATMVQ